MTMSNSDIGPGLRQTNLPNGIRIVSDLMTSVESVTLGAWFDVGSRNETADVGGVAHVLEHMAFKGTHRRRAPDITEEIEAVGGHINAYTAREITAYHAKILKVDVGLAIDILADILQNSVFDEAELAKERAVILQEIGEAADSPTDVMFDVFHETAYPDQALGRPILGRADVVGNMPRSAVVDFVASHYGGEQMVFSAAGNIDHDTLAEAVARGFGTLAPKPPQPAAAACYRGGEARIDRDLEQVNLALGFPGLGYHDPDLVAMAVFARILGGGMSSRLFQEIRERRGLAYSIQTFGSTYRDAGLFGIYAGTGEQQVAELVAVICDELAEFANSDLDAEVARARTQLISGILMGRESTYVRCEDMADNLLTYGRIIGVPELIDRIEAVDPDAVRRVARRMIQAVPTLVAIGPLSHLEDYDSVCRRLGAAPPSGTM